MKRNLFVVFMVLALALTACSVTVNNGNPTQAPAAPVQVNVTVEQNANQQVDVKPAGCTTCAAATEPEPTPSPTAEQPAPTAVAPTNTPIQEPTKAPELTEIVATPAATVEVHKPAQLQTVKVNGVEYGTDFDNRIAFTNGEILTGHTAPYDDTELSLIQTTWVEYTIEMPANAAFPVAFGYSVELENGKSFSPGAIILLPVDQGVVKVKVLDGEIVLWRDLSAMHRDISDRISTEIANGNLSIDRPLAFSFCSQEFSSYVPRELLDARKVTIVK